MESLGNYVIYLTLIATVVGFFYYNKLPNKKAKSLLALILLSFLAEVIGRNFPYWFELENYIVFNLYILITLNSYIILLGLLLKKSASKRASSVFLLLLNLLFVIDMIYLHDIFEGMLTYYYTFGSTLVLILSSLYFVEMFNSNRSSHYKKSIYFWYILGILLFYIPFLPFMLASKMFLFENPAPLFGFMLFSVNVLMYGSFVIGFIWSNKKYNY